MKKLTLITIVLVIGFFAAAILFGSVFSAPLHQDVAVPADLHAEAVKFESGSGSNLSGSWIEGEPGKPVILLMHGVRANRLALFPRAQWLKSLGYSVFLFDFQAHGESPGSRITFGYLESRDARAAFDYVRKRKPEAKVAVIGLSMGGAAALVGEGGPLPAAAMVLEGVYPSIEIATDNRVRRWIGPLSALVTPVLLWNLERRLGISREVLKPVDRMAQVTCPVLVLSGAEDRHTTIEDTRALFAAIQGTKELVIVSGAGHVDLMAADPDGYKRAVLAFLGSMYRPPK